VRAARVGERPGLGPDYRGHLLDELVVEGGARGDGLRELGRRAELAAPGVASVVGDAVQGLVPPLVGGQAEAGDAWGVAVV